MVFLTQVVTATDFGISSDEKIGQGNEISLNTTNIPISQDISESARDAVKLSDGTLLVYNGTFDPNLSVYSNNVWSDLTFSGWSTVNNGTYGGIASDNRFVWVTDMRTFGDPEDELHGIVQFDLEGQVPDVRFADNIEPIDLTLGKDGLLYALYPGGSPSGRYVDVYNPNDASFIKTISLADIFGHTAHRSIAVDENSNMYIADWDGDLQMIDSEGNILSTLDVGGSLYDVDIVDGKIISGDRFGKVYIADLQLQNYQEYLSSDLNSGFDDSGVFILGDSVDTSNIIIDYIFADDFE
ncbi:hypothetical protein [Marinicella rhabdoformis]|uniref:hypothetical protein n=1 Tax=Marinicella rhabdoformis TaxID=2580566 RepID=UPI0012AECDF9|nr:hypothetical protein [Marinicella rhabdoformis]